MLVNPFVRNIKFILHSKKNPPAVPGDLKFQNSLLLFHNKCNWLATICVYISSVL